VASAAPNAQSDGFFSNLARKVGLVSADTTASAQPIPAKPRVIEAKRSEPSRPDGSILRASKPEPKQATARPPLKPSISDTPAAAAPAAKDSMVAGSAPIVSSNSFDSRFSAMK
jgi:hypothetical protein